MGTLSIFIRVGLPNYKIVPIIILANSSLEPRIGRRMSFIRDTKGAPEAGSLNLVLFFIYPETTLIDLRTQLPQRVTNYIELALDVKYADDTDFVSDSHIFLFRIEEIDTRILAK